MSPKVTDFCFVIVVVNHSLNITNGAANDTDHGLVDDMTAVLTTTVTACTETVTQTTTERFTERFTVYLPGLCSLFPTPNSSPTQSSDTAGSTSCSSSDTDNTPIYVAVAIVIVGLLVTITIVVVGVLMCRCYWQGQEQPFRGHTNLLFVKDKTKSSLTNTESDLHGKEGLG